MRREKISMIYLAGYSDGLSTESLFNYSSNGLGSLENVCDLLACEVAQSRNNALGHNEYIYILIKRVKFDDRKAVTAYMTRTTRQDRMKIDNAEREQSWTPVESLSQRSKGLSLRSLNIFSVEPDLLCNVEC